MLSRRVNWIKRDSIAERQGGHFGDYLKPPRSDDRKIYQTHSCRCGVTLALLTLFLGYQLSATAICAEVWLSGSDPLVRSGIQPGVTTDYFDIFSANAPWSQAAAGVSVYKIGGSLAGHGPEGQLRQIFSDLRSRHILLALEIEPLTARNACGHNVAGYWPASEVARMVERIHRLGGDLRYVAMDGPLWNAHTFDSPTACHAPISDIAKDVATKVSAIRGFFPDAQVGDIEPVGRVDPEDWIDQIMQWTQAYHDAVGESLSFLHVDTLWSGPWRDQIGLLAPRLHAAGIKFGIIYNGDPDDPTDLAWTRHAEQRFAAIEADAS